MNIADMGVRVCEGERECVWVSNYLCTIYGYLIKLTMEWQIELLLCLFLFFVFVFVQELIEFN